MKVPVPDEHEIINFQIHNIWAMLVTKSIFHYRIWASRFLAPKNCHFLGAKRWDFGQPNPKRKPLFSPTFSTYGGLNTGSEEEISP